MMRVWLPEPYWEAWGDRDPGGPFPEAIEVTALDDPARSFIPAAPDVTPAEAAEFCRIWDVLTCSGALDVPAGRKAPPPRACLGCGLDDLPLSPGGWCFWCAELAALRARNLPGLPLGAWWYAVPAGLAAVLAVVILYVILYVILAA